MKLNEKQKEVLNRVDELIKSDTQHELLITGQSGTGKSTVVKAICKYIEDQKLLTEMIGIKDKTLPVISLTASTNKAAAVLSQLTDRPARTIHSLLALRPKVDFETGECTFLPSKGTFMQNNAIIIIDEMSFIDFNTYQVIQEQTHNCKIIWVGDHYQLKPVNSKYIPVHQHCTNILELTEIMRNKGGIQALGKQFRKSIDSKEMPNLSNSDNVSILNRKDYITTLEKCFLKGEDAKIISWRNVSVLSYNKYIQEQVLQRKQLVVDTYYIVNDGVTMKNVAGQHVYFPTDSLVKLLEIIGETDDMLSVALESLKGETCIFEIPKMENGKRILLKRAAKEKNWKEYYKIKDAVIDIRLPYASTVNKAQGSTHDYIFLDLGDILKCNNPDTLYRMLYVAATRASKHLFIYDSLVE